MKQVGIEHKTIYMQTNISGSKPCFHKNNEKVTVHNQYRSSLYMSNLVWFWDSLQIELYLQVIPTGKILILTCNLDWFWDFL